MKRFLITIILCLCSLNLFAQNRVYCEIVEKTPLIGKKVKVIVDFGQIREKGKISQALVDDEGEVINFNSKIDALNFMDRLGWNFLQAYTVVDGGSSSGTGSTSSEVHWLLYKNIIQGVDPYKGLTTKEMHNK